MESTIQYRPEIDGLRAIAVLSVVLYHAGLGPKAGYVGVDIFFVISGYLITYILRAEWLKYGRIDIPGFYVRRLRRIFAALYFVVISTVMLSLFVLSPFGEVKSLTESAAASLLFVSNYYFELTTGDYFAQNSDKLPLLHLWSLSVEEQFYLIWPVFLVLLFRYRGGSLRSTLAVIAIVAVGGYVALLSVGRFKGLRIIISLSVIVLFLAILIPIPHFPGIGALPAVAGTALLLRAIHSGEQLGFHGQWLSVRPLVFVGVVSYSLYLWHWPLLALVRATHVESTAVFINIILCAVAFLMACISYKFIEVPVRYADAGAKKYQLIIASIALLSLSAFTVVKIGNVYNYKPVPTDLAYVTEQDFPSDRFSCHFRGGESPSPIPKETCSTESGETPGVVIWGDSIALAWRPLARMIAKQLDQSFSGYTRDSCGPLLNYQINKGKLERDRCVEFNSLVESRLSGVSVLILAANWSSYLQDVDNINGNQKFISSLKKTIERVLPLVNRIVIIGPTPKLNDKVPSCIRLSKLDHCKISRKEFEESSAFTRKSLMALAEQNKNIMYIEPIDFFCTESDCPALKDGYGLYWDDFHISTMAAKKFSEDYLEESSISELFLRGS
ncbi:MAG: acyltransferase family protein [Candidatus Thiodiazotropha sp.]